MKRIFAFFYLTLIFSSPLLFAQAADSAENAEGDIGADSEDAFAIIPNLEAEETKDIDASRTRAIFNTNLKNCRIYLNHNFQGLTKLTLNNLVEGFYLLRVEQDGYQYKENFVYIEHGKEKSFYIELEPTEETQKKQEARANAREAARTRTPASSEAAAENNAQESGREPEPDVTSTESFGDAK